MAKKKPAKKKSKKPAKRRVESFDPTDFHTDCAPSCPEFKGVEQYTPQQLKEADEIVKELVKNMDAKKKPWWKFW